MALIGLEHWLKSYSDSGNDVPVPPDHLINEIGMMIATRRKELLLQALFTARWIFNDGSETYHKIVDSWILYGLDLLHSELDYDRNRDDEELDQVPELRWGCVNLALAMSKSGYGEESPVKKWVESMEDDPLPEVRYADIPNHFYS
jgi:hypothetical protein